MSGSELDSVYNKFLQVRAPQLVERPQVLTREDLKCGFDIVTTVKINFNNFSPDQQKLLAPLVSRPVLETSMDSPFGFFRIHFNSSGPSAPSYISGTVTENVMEVAFALDSVYKYEIQYLNYPLPPPDNNGGGNNLYDVYIVNQPGGLYGYTEPEFKIGTTNWTSFMVIDNNYVGYYSQGLDGMEVTVAHEFHHGIQVGNYAVLTGTSPFRSGDVYFYEITSTAMEEFVFDDVNDYYAYMPDYFMNAHKAFPNQNGYNLAIWNIYLQKNFGFEILKKQWELIPIQQAILAIGNSILDRYSTFARELNRFGIWTYYTGHRTVAGYFEEAASYPLISPHSIIPFPQFNSVQVDAQETSNSFLVFNNTSNNDSLFVIATNGDINSTTLRQNPQNIFDYILYANANSGQRKLTDDYSSDFIVSDPNWWSVSEILNGLIVREDSAIVPIPDIAESLVFPNPFKYSGNLSISIETNLGDELDFNVYSSGLRLLYSSRKGTTVLRNNTIGINWDGLDKNGNKLASGVYIYVIKNGDEVIKGKVVIFNE